MDVHVCHSDAAFRWYLSHSLQVVTIDQDQFISASLLQYFKIVYIFPRLR
jgi:hypothetical protein